MAAEEPAKAQNGFLMMKRLPGRLSKVKQAHLDGIKSLSKPSDSSKLVARAIACLLGEAKSAASWLKARQLLAQPSTLKRIKEIQLKTLPPATADTAHDLLHTADAAQVKADNKTLATLAAWAADVITIVRLAPWEAGQDGAAAEEEEEEEEEEE